MRGFYSNTIYKHFPVSFQNAFLSIKGVCYTFIRKGFSFAKYQKRVSSVEGLSKEQIDAMQFAKLKELLVKASRFVPYYQRIFGEIGFSPEAMNCLEDITKIPLLDKQTILSQPESFLATNSRNRFLMHGWTSGSSGMKLSVKMDREVVKLEYAFADRQYQWAGVSSDSRTAILRGDLIVPIEMEKGPYWRYDAFNKQMWFSSYHISDATIKEYAQKLVEFAPELIFAYPSSISILCQLVKSQKLLLKIPSLKCVVTSSEMLLPKQRKSIEECLGVKVFDWYGHFERAIFIGTCEMGSYHIFPDYGLTELLPSGVNENGEALYELVGTGFINNVMPLIRYRTGDLVTLKPEDHCSCGRKFPCVKDIMGRINDVVVTETGRRIGMLEFAFDNEFVRTGQIIQESLRKLTVLVVPEDGQAIEAEIHVIAALRERIGSGMEIDFQCVEAIPRLLSGKSRMVISRL